MNFAQYLPTSLQGLMPDGSGNTPNQLPQDDTMMQLELKRKFALADALKNQAMPEGQMVSGHYVAPSWTQYLANAVGKYQGGQAENQAIKQYGDYTKDKTAKLGALLSDLQQGKEVQTPVDYNEAGNQPGITQATRQPYNDQEYMARVGAAMPELMPKMLESVLTNRFKEEAPMTVAQGGTVIDKKGNVIYQAPTKEDKTTFSTLGKLTSELQTIRLANPNDPRIKQYEDAINKETTSNPSGLAADYTFAKANGYKGSIEDFKRIPTSWINPYQAKELNLKEQADNPLGLVKPQPSNQPNNSLLNPPKLSIGQVVNGFKWNGGDPNAQSSWSK